MRTIITLVLSFMANSCIVPNNKLNGSDFNVQTPNGTDVAFLLFLQFVFLQ